jgi:putative sporulation protein YyaC
MKRPKKREVVVLPVNGKFKVKETDELKSALSQVMPKGMNRENVLFVCIGTDRSTGDSLGPMIGTQLKKAGFNVLGTLDEPVHAMNIEDIVSSLPEDKFIIGIDACLGQVSSIGLIETAVGSVRPGAGVGKDLPKVGDAYITGIVNVSGFMEYFVLQNTRLSLVMDMADKIVAGIKHRFPKTNKKVVIL